MRQIENAIAFDQPEPTFGSEYDEFHLPARPETFSRYFLLDTGAFAATASIISGRNSWPSRWWASSSDN
jgi:hypothetical protein